MGEEFNIFKNLEELKKTNLLDQLKSLEPTKVSDQNDSQTWDNDDFDFDSIVDNKTSKNSPSKRKTSDKTPVSPEKKTKKKNIKSRRTSVSTDGSLSPTMPLFENLTQKVEDLPVSRRTRRSFGTCSQSSETVLENIDPSASKCRGRGKGRGRGRRRGRGRGRGRGKSSNSSFDNTIDSTNSSEISLDNVQELSSNEVSGQESDATCQPSIGLGIMERFLQQGRTGRSRVMRARRQYIAEIAARSTQVDYVDLVSSPMPRVEGFIDLDLEEETQRTTRGKKKNQSATKTKNIPDSKNPALEISFDEDNPEVNIKVNWKGKPEAFKLRKHQKFSVIFEELAKREDIGIENIVFNLNDRIIVADDTPDSINYKIFHFIDGRVLSKSFSSPRPATTISKKRDANKITLKIQSDKWKKPLQIEMMKSDKFRILYIKCAEELKVGLDQLKLSFDGELLELNDTPADLELEGGEAIDLRIKD